MDKDKSKESRTASIFSSLTIGIPFCMYKFLFGMLVIRNHMELPGWIIIIWALADALMNLARSSFLLAQKKSPIETCTLAQLGRLFNRTAVFLAIDTLLSFSIICFVLWSRWITELRPQESPLWYLATTINLASLSIVSLWSEIRKPRPRAEQ
ncbi:MAG: hypothetical protein RDV48_20605 [Candidatus Eremiobacteraeota bacterium]|nr:hypothetical protein [Candidatus Eremiobacteraeota bacterium]